MKPVLLDISVCVDALVDRPERLLKKFHQFEDVLHLSSLTAFQLYSGVERIDAETKTLLRELDAFVARFNWLDLSYDAVRSMAAYGREEMGSAVAMPQLFQMNLQIARYNGLTYIVSQNEPDKLLTDIPGVVIEAW